MSVITSYSIHYTKLYEVMLRRAGFEQVANLAGGMLRWRAEALPVEGGRD